MNSSYTNIYWNLPSTFENLLQSTVEKNTDFREAFNYTKDKIKFDTKKQKYIITKTGADSIEFVQKFRGPDSVLYQKALLMNHPGLKLSGIDEYMEYANSVSRCEKLIETSKIDRKDIDERKFLAGVVYHRLRVTSIILRNLLDSDWLLNSKRKWRYDSEVADPKFYFKTIFLHSSTSDSILNSIINLEFNYKARNFNAFEPVDTIMYYKYQKKLVKKMGLN